MDEVRFDHALLPEGWRRDVVIGIEGGLIRSIRADAPQSGVTHGGAIALPGLASLHSHTFQRGMAGLAEVRGPSGDSFWTWRRVMYRFLGQLTPDDVEAIAAFAFMEMLEGGFTSIGEFHYLHHAPDGSPYADRAELSGRIVAAARDSGIGLTLLPVLYSHGGFGGQPPVEGQRRFLNDRDGYAALLDGARVHARGLPHSVVGIAPHSLRAVSPGALTALVGATPAGPVHIHIAEQEKEVADCLGWSGARPVEWLLANQPVDARWCLIHATHMTDAETRGVAAAGAVAGLCPITEANLGDGVFNLGVFQEAGGRFGVGTDSNVEITAPGELKQLEYSQRLHHRGRNLAAGAEGQSTGETLYCAAAAGGAQALARGRGILAAGEAADIVVLDAAHPDLAHGAVGSVLDRYAFVAGSRCVSAVYSGGIRVVDHGVHRLRDAISRRYIETMRRVTADW